MLKCDKDRLKGIKEGDGLDKDDCVGKYWLAWPMHNTDFVVVRGIIKRKRGGKEDDEEGRIRKNMRWRKDNKLR